MSVAAPPPLPTDYIVEENMMDGELCDVTETILSICSPFLVWHVE